MDLPPNVVVEILKREKCVDMLKEWSQARHASSTQGKIMLSQYDDHAKIAQNFLVKLTAGGYSLLTWRDTGEEVVLDVCGLLSVCELPPLGRKAHTVGKRSHIASLVGPDCVEFKRALSARKKIHKYFQDTIREGDLRPLAPYIYGDLDGIQAETRFLTPVSNNVFELVELDHSNDPNGMLRQMTSLGKLVYTEDNVMTFEAVTEDTDGKLTRTEAHPGVFRRGQLVEASICFRTVTAGPKQSFLTRLDSLLLVNRIGADEILDHQESIKQILPPASKISIPKRCRPIDNNLEAEQEVFKKARRGWNEFDQELPPSDAMLMG